MIFLYCPACGEKLGKMRVDGRSRNVCNTCGYIHYRNPTPASAVVLLQNEKILLVKRKFEPKKGFWSLPAGFVEYDESPKQAAVRETKEETGLDVEIVSLVGVYAGYDDPRVHVVLIVYKAEKIRGVLSPGDDAVEVGFFSSSKIPENIAFKSHRKVLERVFSEENI